MNQIESLEAEIQSKINDVKKLEERLQKSSPIRGRKKTNKQNQVHDQPSANTKNYNSHTAPQHSEERVESRAATKKSTFDSKSRMKSQLDTSKSRSKTNERKQSKQDGKKEKNKAEPINITRVDSLESDDEEQTESKSHRTERPATKQAGKKTKELPVKPSKQPKQNARDKLNIDLTELRKEFMMKSKNL